MCLCAPKFHVLHGSFLQVRWERIGLKATAMLSKANGPLPHTGRNLFVRNLALFEDVRRSARSSFTSEHSSKSILLQAENKWGCVDVALLGYICQSDFATHHTQFPLRLLKREGSCEDHFHSKLAVGKSCSTALFWSSSKADRCGGS